MYRLDHKYDLVIPIKYNFKKPIIGKGSAIFLHLTKNYNCTAGCIALNQNDFLILLKLINRKTKIKIIQISREPNIFEPTLIKVA